MAKMNDFLKNLQKMDQNQLQALIKQATSSLSPSQQLKLKKMLENPQAMSSLQSKISEKDIGDLEQSLSSPETLKNYLNQPDIQKRINEIL